MEGAGELDRPVVDLKRVFGAWMLAFGLTSVVLLIGILPPFVSEPVRGFMMAAMEPFCHQIPDRSFHVNGVQLAVCHRCLGIYAGIPIAIVGYLILRRWDGFFSPRAKAILLMSLVPLAVDWSLNYFGVWTNTDVSRLITGSIFGLTAGYYIALGIVNIGVPAAKREANSESVALDAGNVGAGDGQKTS